MAGKKLKTDEKTRARVQRYREQKAKQGQKAISLTVPIRHERDLRALAQALRDGRNDAPWPSPARVQELEQLVKELSEQRDEIAGERDLALQRLGAAEAERDKARAYAQKSREKMDHTVERARAAEQAQKNAEKREYELSNKLEGDGFRQWLARRLIRHKIV